MLRFTSFASASIIAFAAATSQGFAQQAAPDASYMAKIAAVAPPTVVKNATVIQIDKAGTTRTLQTGTNGFTCVMMTSTTGGCADKNAMAWMHAYMTHSTPPAATGFAYMLAGDDGASNTDPYGNARTSDNHWVVTGPHVMIVGASATTMGYPTTADADPSAPFVMWAGTQYAHVMIPVTVQP